MGRPIELILEIFLLLSVFGILYSGLRRKGEYIAGGLIALLLIQMVIEGPRLIMTIVYAMAIMMAIIFIIVSKRSVVVVHHHKKKKQWLLLLCYSSLVFGSLVAICIPLAFPVFTMPRPTGPYAVGKTTWHMTDKSRGETYTADPNDLRELAAHVFYPASVRPGSQRAGYIEYSLTDLPSSVSCITKLILKHLAMSKSRHYLDVPIAADKEKYPVLLFSHGYGSKTEWHTSLLEEAASRGYITISVDHTYDCVFTVLPGNRYVFEDNSNGKENELSAEERKRLKELTYRMFNNPKKLDPVEYENIWGELYQKNPMAKKVRLWARDIQYTLNEVERINGAKGNTPFSGKMDLQHMGVFGMSLGGASALQFCYEDHRCKAVINIDGSPNGDLVSSGKSLQMPSLFFMSKNIYTWKPLPESVRSRELLFERFTRKTYRVKIDRSTHLSFTDCPLWSPVVAFIFNGSFSGERTTTIINDYAMAFFDHHLKGEFVPHFDGSIKKYPEVELSIRN